MPDLEFWRTVGLGAMALGQLGFVFLYATFPWWQTFLGRALFLKAVTLGALCVVAFLARVGDWAYEDEAFVSMYWLLSLGIWAQFLAFLRVKYVARRLSERNPL